jgi:hypothetical protein
LELLSWSFRRIPESELCASGIHHDKKLREPTAASAAAWYLSITTVGLSQIVVIGINPTIDYLEHMELSN